MVTFEKTEYQKFLKITHILHIRIIDLKKRYRLKEIPNPVKTKIDYDTMIKILKSDISIFTIRTNKKDYQCKNICINLSSVIDEFVKLNPGQNTFFYDFLDEYGEFQDICNFFNFEKVFLTPKNMNSIKKISEELKINIILNEIDNYIDDYNKFSEIITQQQESIDQIDELFEYLSKSDVKTVSSVKNFIIESQWSKTKEGVQELADFILQVVDSDLLLHQHLIEMLIQIESESNEQNQLKLLIPIIVKKLMNSFGKNIQNCSFIYLMKKQGFISKEKFEKKLMKELNTYKIIKDKKNDLETDDQNINDTFFKYSESSEIISAILTKTAILIWFLPEIIEIKNLKNPDLLLRFGHSVDSFVKYYFYKIDLYKKMRDRGEPDDQLTLALRRDDLDELQSLINNDHSNVKERTVPYNIYEEFVPNGKTNYLNYSAAYGSIRCFKYLLLNHIKVDEHTFKFAIYGGNFEIINITDQKINCDDVDITVNDADNKPIMENIDNLNDDYVINFINEVASNQQFVYCIVPSIVRHKNDLFDWVLEKIIEKEVIDEKSFSDLFKISVECGNCHALIELFDKCFVFIKEICSKNESNKKFLSEVIERVSKNGFYHLLKIMLNIFENMISGNLRDNILSLNFDNLPVDSYFHKNVYINDHLSFYAMYEKVNIYDIISSKNLSIFKLFAHILTQNELGNILAYAIKNNDIDAVKYFFEDLVKNDYFEITEQRMNLFLTYALLKKSDDIYNYLIEQMKLVNPAVFDNFHWSISHVINSSHSNNIKATKYITNEILKEKPDEDFLIPFLNAVSLNSIELIHFFMDQKVKISFEEISNHIDRLLNTNEETFSIIIENIPPKILYKAYDQIFIRAINAHNKFIVESILKKISNINYSLFLAIKESDLEIVKIILKYNSKPKFVNKRIPKGTALCLAVQKNSLEIVKELLCVPGIDVNLYDSSKSTPLIIAANN